MVQDVDKDSKVDLSFFLLYFCSSHKLLVEILDHNT